ncbi:TlyA family RNA methyltransferase [Alloscardovia venturai]|uniref:TlyA family RNA methyltransferase n=1 Tax=Alloscardovia venturai TaxID=1769421 RepID=A0ABW2Y6D2_9BIFI
MVQRLDKELVSRGLVSTRSRAHQLIDSRAVVVNGKLDRVKASLKVNATDEISVIEDAHSARHYVSRGAIKLLNALDLFIPQGFPLPEDTCCLDIGASTGGFTQVLLDKGARKVIALDVGHNQLDQRIARDTRVIEMSGTNIRDVNLETLPFSPEITVSDVSFISLTYVIPVIARITKPGAHGVLLIKPQFEVGRAKLGKGGIVSKEEHRQEAISTVTSCAKHYSFDVRGVIPSAITGTHGNQEYLLWITRL